MHKTVSINIGGTLFTLDEAAYTLLKEYIAKLKSIFANIQGGDEITVDLEIRASELLQEKVSHNKNPLEQNIVTLEMIESVIETLGNPEDLIDEEEITTEEFSKDNSGHKETKKSKRPKRLYRNPLNRIMLGVCGGIAQFLNINPIIIRLIFFILLWVYGAGILLYIILGLLIPKAKTPTQIFEMKGEEFNLNNIKENLEEGIADIKEHYDNITNSPKFKEMTSSTSPLIEKFTTGLQSIFDLILSILTYLIKKIGVILLFAWKVVKYFGTIILTFGGLFGIAVCILLLFMPDNFTDFFQVDRDLQFMLNNSISVGHVVILKGILALLIGIPSLLFLYIASKVITRYRSNTPIIIGTGVGVWIITWILFGFFAIVYSGHKSEYAAEETEMIAVNQDENSIESISIKVKDSGVLSSPKTTKPYFEWDNRSGRRIKYTETVNQSGDKTVTFHPFIRIKESDSDQFFYTIKTSSQGSDINAVSHYINEVSYNVEVKDSTIYIDKYAEIAKEREWNRQTVVLTLYIPKGKRVTLDPMVVNNLVNNISHRDNKDSYLYLNNTPISIKRLNEIRDMEFGIEDLKPKKVEVEVEEEVKVGKSDK